MGTPDPLDYLDGICSNSHTLKLAYSPQGMLSLIDQNGCSVMKKKDGECPDPEAKLHKRYNILSFHYVRSMISRGYILTKHYSGNIAALFLDDTLMVDVSIAEESIFGILGSEKLSEKPMNGTHVCGQTIVEAGMYTTVRRLLLVQ